MAANQAAFMAQQRAQAEAQRRRQDQARQAQLIAKQQAARDKAAADARIQQQMRAAQAAKAAQEAAARQAAAQRQAQMINLNRPQLPPAMMPKPTKPVVQKPTAPAAAPAPLPAPTPNAPLLVTPIQQPQQTAPTTPAPAQNLTQPTQQPQQPTQNQTAQPQSQPLTPAPAPMPPAVNLPGQGSSDDMYNRYLAPKPAPAPAPAPMPAPAPGITPETGNAPPTGMPMPPPPSDRLARPSLITPPTGMPPPAAGNQPVTEQLSDLKLLPGPQFAAGGPVVGQPGMAQMPTQDFNTMSADELQKIAYANNEDWGSLYNKLKSSDLYNTWNTGYNDYRKMRNDVSQQVVNQYGKPADQSLASSGQMSWDDYNKQQSQFNQRINDAMQLDPRYNQLKGFGGTSMFNNWLSNQNDPNNATLQQFKANDAYFKRFVEPNLRAVPTAEGLLGFAISR